MGRGFRGVKGARRVASVCNKTGVQPKILGGSVVNRPISRYAKVMVAAGPPFASPQQSVGVCLPRANAVEARRPRTTTSR